MKPEIRAALTAQTEARQALNALPEDANDEDRSAAVTALTTADQALLEALEKDQDVTDRDLVSECRIANYLGTIAHERSITGAEKELNTELALNDNVIPLEMLEPLPEQRADAISPQGSGGSALAAGTVNQTRGPLLARVFTRTDARFLGVAMPTVPPGERVYPVMTDGTTAGMVERAAAGPDAGAAKFGVVNASPKRLTGRYVFDLEGVAELGGLLETTLRSDLRTELGFQFDSQILNGSGADGQVSGLLNQLPLIVPPGQTLQASKDSEVMTWLLGRRIGISGLDGKLSRTESDIRLLIGGDTYTLLRELYRKDNSGDAEDAVTSMRELGMTLSRSFQIPAPAAARISGSNGDSTKKVQSAIANSEPGAAVAPVWQGITLIRDPYTDASKAQIVLTAHMLFDFVMRRKDGWKRYAVRTET